MEDSTNNLFRIPEQNFKKFEEAIEKFSRKAQKLCGESITPVVFGYEMVDIPGGQQIKVFEVLLDCLVPKLNGWSFVARIDHSNGEVGNIVRPMPGKVLDEKYRTVGSVCQHCNVKRFRRDTFVVEHEDGTEKQVGSTCLKDFLGHESSEKIGKLAELLGYAAECARGYGNVVGEDRRYINLDVYLAHVAKCIREMGYYVTRRMASEHGMESTSSRALTDMNNFNKSFYTAPTEADQEMAERAIEWAQNLGEDGTALNDYQHNIKVIAASGCCEFRSMGFAASIVNGYIRETVPRTTRPVSQHIGQEGQRVDLDVVLKNVRAIETDFGGTYLHNFETLDGNVVKVFTGKRLCEDGKTVKLRGTVKKHDEYKGQKQTVLSRPVVK